MIEEHEGELARINKAGSLELRHIDSRIALVKISIADLNAAIAELNTRLVDTLTISSLLEEKYYACVLIHAALLSVYFTVCLVVLFITFRE